MIGSRRGYSPSSMRSSEELEARVDDVIAEFHKLYYGAKMRTWTNTFWLGHRARKCPLDLWVYQEIIVETQPDVIVETGTAAGGSALFLASVCDLVGSGRVLTIDITELPDRPQHERIQYFNGSSTDPGIVEAVRAKIPSDGRVMAVLDSDHHEAHVLRELQTYAPLVTSGNYVIVEDSNLGLVRPDFGPGPMEAINQFLSETDAFEVDREREKFFMTFNPRGYLRKRN
jgi:cephalosporin hydroxylase